MGIWVKTTIDISDTIFKQVRKQAEQAGMTFRQVVESALSEFLARHKKNAKPFKLKKHPFKGDGLVEGLNEGDWETIRSLIYEGRGG